MKFIIRRCHIGDETSLSVLGKAAFLETYGAFTQAADLLAFVETEHSAERYRSWLESHFARIWVAETALEGPAIGYAVALASPNAGFGVEMELKRLYVLHRFQRNGLGHLLMSEVLATARQTGIDELFLKVLKVNQSAVNFYSSSGFRVGGEETFQVGARDYAVLAMRLSLGIPARDTPRQSVAVKRGVSAGVAAEILRPRQG